MVAIFICIVVSKEEMMIFKIVVVVLLLVILGISAAMIAISNMSGHFDTNKH